MNKEINIVVIGLGQIGSYLLKELNNKKKDILNKTGKKLMLLPFRLKIKIKKELLK